MFSWDWVNGVVFGFTYEYGDLAIAFGVFYITIHVGGKHGMEAFG